MRIWLIAAAFAIFLVATAGAAEMEFVIAGRKPDCLDCGWIAAEGAITLDTADRLVALLDKERLIAAEPRIELHSDGGSLLGALQLGRVIRERGLATRIARSQRGPDTNGSNPNASIPGARCVSACAFAFLGGAVRQIAPDAVLAFGSFASETAFFKPAESLFNALELPLARVMEGVLLEYVVGMGIDTRVVALAAKTAPGEIRPVAIEEAQSLGIVPIPVDPSAAETAQDPDVMGSWQIGVHRDGVVAFSRSSDGLTQVTLYCNSGARRRRYAIVKSDKPEISGKIQEFLAASDGRSAFGRPLQRSAFAYNTDDPDAGVRFVLPDVNFDRIAEPTTISLDIEESKDPLAIHLPAEGLRDATRVAFRNCLS